MLQETLSHLQDPVVWTGLAQVGAAVAQALLAVLLSWQRGLKLEAELNVAFVRGFVQIVAVRLVIGLLLAVPVTWSALILLGIPQHRGSRMELEWAPDRIYSAVGSSRAYRRSSSSSSGP